MGIQTSVAEAPTNSVVSPSSIILLQGNSIISNDSGAFKNEMESYLWEMTEKYGLQYDKIYQIIKCESQWKENAKGDNGRAFGLLQFHRATFYSYAKLYGHTEMEWKNSYDQISLGVEMIANGEFDNWSCWRN